MARSPLRSGRHRHRAVSYSTRTTPRYDESLETLEKRRNARAAATGAPPDDAAEFARRAAVDRELSAAPAHETPPSNALFDESGRMLLCVTCRGIAPRPCPV